MNEMLGAGAWTSNFCCTGALKSAQRNYHNSTPRVKLCRTGCQDMERRSAEVCSILCCVLRSKFIYLEDPASFRQKTLLLPTWHLANG